MSSQYSPTQVRMLKVLGDGFRHTKKELFECLDDDLSNHKAVGVHLFRLRQKLRRVGQDVLVEYYMRKYFYRLVRLISKADA